MRTNDPAFRAGRGSIPHRVKFGAGIEPLVIGRLAALRDILDGEGEGAP